MKLNEEISKEGFRSMTKLRSDTRSVLNMKVKYRLYQIRNNKERIYVISVSADGESKTCFFGQDRTAASLMYKKIVSGSVTPCSIREIAEDFEYSGRVRYMENA